MNKILNRKTRLTCKVRHRGLPRQHVHADLTGFYKIILLSVCIISSVSVQAQRKRAREGKGRDTLTAIREFIQVSNRYQQLPLYLEMEITNTTNFITSEEDTTSVQAVFCMKPGITYVKFGDTEQLVNDSMALLVSDKLQRMILYSNAQPLLQRMKTVTGMLLQDSSVQELANRFTATASSPEQQVSSITLTGREPVYGTSLPKESVEMQYDSQTKEPLQVVTVKRSLLPVTEAEYKILAGRNEMAGKLLAPEGKGYYVVKEQSVTFMYKTIKHEAGMQIPATIADRITRNEQGAFIPVKAYKAYAMTLN